MKKTINKIVFGSFLSLALVACVDDFEYTPAPAEDASKSYAGVDMNAPRNLDIDGSDIKVPFVRTNATSAMDITVALTDTSGLFTLKNATISFAAGETTANAEVSYSYDALDPAAEYAITVAITAGEVSQYTSPALPMTCKKAWQNLGVAQWYDDWWIGGPFEKTLLKSPTGEERYRLVNPWDKASVEEGGLEFVEEIPYLEFTIDENGLIHYGSMLGMGFNFNGTQCLNVYPSALGYDDFSPYNCMVEENVARFLWFPVFNYNPSTGGMSWWGKTAEAYISFPGGPDLTEYLEL